METKKYIFLLGIGIYIFAKQIESTKKDNSISIYIELISVLKKFLQKKE